MSLCLVTEYIMPTYSQSAIVSGDANWHCLQARSTKNASVAFQP